MNLFIINANIVHLNLHPFFGAADIDLIKVTTFSVLTYGIYSAIWLGLPSQNVIKLSYYIKINKHKYYLMCNEHRSKTLCLVSC